VVLGDEKAGARFSWRRGLRLLSDQHLRVKVLVVTEEPAPGSGRAVDPVKFRARQLVARRHLEHEVPKVSLRSSPQRYRQAATQNAYDSASRAANHQRESSPIAHHPHPPARTGQAGLLVYRTVIPSERIRNGGAALTLTQSRSSSIKPVSMSRAVTASCAARNRWNASTWPVTCTRHGTATDHQPAQPSVISTWSCHPYTPPTAPCETPPGSRACE
jgi:hypothetical protein